LSTIPNDYAFHHPYDADIEAACELAASDAMLVASGTGISQNRTSTRFTL
jgi:hypothetical protein